jgi:hypothetical protein
MLMSVMFQLFGGGSCREYFEQFRSIAILAERHRIELRHARCYTSSHQAVPAKLTRVHDKCWLGVQ